MFVRQASSVKLITFPLQALFQTKLQDPLFVYLALGWSLLMKPAERG